MCTCVYKQSTYLSVTATIKTSVCAECLAKMEDAEVTRKAEAKTEKTYQLKLELVRLTLLRDKANAMAYTDVKTRLNTDITAVNAKLAAL